MLNLRECGLVESPRQRDSSPGIDTSTASRHRFEVLHFSTPALLLGLLVHAVPVHAIELGQGEVQGSLDTTISHGITWRVGARDEGPGSAASSPPTRTTAT